MGHYGRQNQECCCETTRYHRNARCCKCNRIVQGTLTVCQDAHVHGTTHTNKLIVENESTFQGDVTMNNVEICEKLTVKGDTQLQNVTAGDITANNITACGGEFKTLKVGCVEVGTNLVGDEEKKNIILSASSNATVPKGSLSLSQLTFFVGETSPNRLPLSTFRYSDDVPAKFSLCRTSEDSSDVFAITTNHQFLPAVEEIMDISKLPTENVEVKSVINMGTFNILQNKELRGFNLVSDCWGMSVAAPFVPGEEDTEEEQLRKLSYYVANKPLYKFGVVNTSLETFFVDVSNGNNPKLIPVINRVTNAWEPEEGATPTVIADPLAGLATGNLPNNAPIDISGILQITPGGNRGIVGEYYGDNEPADPNVPIWEITTAGALAPKFADDNDATKVFKTIGQDEYVYYTYANPNAPYDLSNSVVQMKGLGEKKLLTFKLYLRYSTEGGFDFLNVDKVNNIDPSVVVSIASLAGPGPSAEEPYRDAVIDVTLYPTETLRISFVKDAIYYGGIDTVYFYVKDLECVDAVPVCEELDFVPNASPSETGGWGDCKVYDATTLQVSGNVSALSDKINKFVQLKNGKMMRVLTVDGSEVRVETNDMIEAGDQLASSDWTIDSAERTAFAYTIHEGSSSLAVIDLKLLLEDPENPKVEWVNRYFGDDSETDLASLIGTSDWVVSGSHNLMTDATTGRLYIIDTRAGAGNNYIMDLKTSPQAPILVGSYGDGGQGEGEPEDPFETHDMALANYTPQEQMDLLGIPSDQTVPYLNLAFIAQGSPHGFCLADVTDPTNLKWLHIDVFQFTDPGYQHAGWFTTDKRFVVANDEAQLNTITPRNTIYKVYWNTSLGKLQLIEVQNFFTKSLGENHNGYCYTNRSVWPKWLDNVDGYEPNEFYESQEFEDWYYSSNYGVGTEIVSLKYKPGYDFTSTKFMDEPFDITYKGRVVHFPETEASNGEIAWSNYLFGGFEIPAHKADFIGTTSGLITAQYSEGFTQKQVRTSIYETRNLDLLGNNPMIQSRINMNAYKNASHKMKNEMMKELHSANRSVKRSSKRSNKRAARSLAKRAIVGDPENNPNYVAEQDDHEHDPVEISSGPGGITLELRKKDGSGTISKSFNFVISTDEALDLRVYRAQFTEDELNEVHVPVLQDTVDPKELLYGNFQDSGVSEVRLLSEMETMFRSWNPSQSIGRHNGCDETGYIFNKIIENERKSEILVDAPSSPGDCGSPILTVCDGKLVGVVRDRNKRGGVTGLVSAKVIRKLVGTFADVNPVVTSLATEIEGVLNNRMNGITEEDPLKYSVVYHSPLTDRIYSRYFHSVYSTYPFSGIWQSKEASNVLGGWLNYDVANTEGSGKNAPIKFGDLGVFQLNFIDPRTIGETQLGYTRRLLVGNDNWRHMTKKLEVSVTSGTFEDIMEGEELQGTILNGGPAVVVIKKLSGSGASGELEVYVVTTRTPRFIIDPEPASEVIAPAMPEEDQIGPFSTDAAKNPLGLIYGVHPPKAGDTLVGEMSGVTVQIPGGYDYNSADHNLTYVDPSWVGTEVNEPYGTKQEPIENPTWYNLGERIPAEGTFRVPPVGLYKKTNLEAVMPLAYVPPVAPFAGALLGVQVSQPKHKELKVEETIPQIEAQFPGNQFQHDDQILAIDGVAVDKDTFWSEYLHKRAGSEYTVTVKRGESEVELSRTFLLRKPNMLSLV